MVSRNGELPTTMLATVAPGVQLAKGTANAYRSLVLLGELYGTRIRPASGVGSGYRNLALQKLFYAASMGDAKAAAQVGLSSSSSVAVAQPGLSSHGRATRIDLVFDGSDNPSAAQLELAAYCGFDREFGSRDRNHFKHDGVTFISGPGEKDRARIVAHYLNRRHLGGISKVEQTGARDLTGTVEQTYWYLMQRAGNLDNLYPIPPFKDDGKTGPKSKWLEKHYWGVLWNG